MRPHGRREFLETLGAFAVLSNGSTLVTIPVERTMVGGSWVFEA